MLAAMLATASQARAPLPAVVAAGLAIGLLPPAWGAPSAAALLLAPRIGQQFDGIVTGASDKGTWVRITGPAAEGRIVRGFEGLRVGDRVRVQLLHTDAARGFIDFALAKGRS